VPNREEEVEETLHRLEDQYVLAVILLLLSIVVYAFTGDDRIGRLVTVAVQGITLLVILDASHAPKPTARAASRSSGRCSRSAGPSRSSIASCDVLTST